MTSENTPDPMAVREFLEVLHPLLRRMRAERTLSPGKVGILHHLSLHERATSTELAAAVRVSPQAISLAARELEEMAFIERVPDADDRRKTWIVLAGAGRAKLEDEARAGEGWIGQAITGQLTDDERRILKEAIPVLKKIGLEVPRG
ncbi:MarR family winged helix-turn-helix transcriptional regulator [Paeniglutamicibacter sp.]|uniref:MarR family winged helix-turn-helix transcriptional regulator n=1 Tax=Paeniglutamicibacter sp. TaxID=1934391 RepID=UPI003988A232